MDNTAEIIIASATLVSAVGGAVLGILNRQKLVTQEIKIKEVHEATNGLTKRLESAATATGFEKGLSVGQADLNPPVNRASKRKGR